ncbi:MAG: hypothetical protein HY762_08345 [Planctomycetes bacterium]|nr:hypothetical protein [Planctomycetota bacterium]
MKRYLLLAALLTGVANIAIAAGPGNPAQPKDPVNAAIERGVAYLKSKPITNATKELELVALTLRHCDIKPNDPVFKDLLNKALSKSLSQTYNVSVKAMLLESVDRLKYQSEIAECAQALVNWQSTEGCWDYNVSYKKDKDLKPVKTKGRPQLIEVITDKEGTAAKTDKPKELESGYEVKRNNPKRPSGGDNSNTQFALLGLRAAARSGVTIPKETWADAAQWLTRVQSGDGGWTYTTPQEGVAYGSMTCAAVCGLAIAKCYLEQDFKNDRAIRRGIDWLSKNLQYDTNPNVKNSVMKDWGPWHYYWVYGVERVAAVIDL